MATRLTAFTTYITLDLCELLRTTIRQTEKWLMRFENSPQADDEDRAKFVRVRIWLDDLHKAINKVP